MKALTLWQPWASAVVAGLKYVEFRDWRTNYRGYWRFMRRSEKWMMRLLLLVRIFLSVLGRELD